MRDNSSGQDLTAVAQGCRFRLLFVIARSLKFLIK
jgi:hypothetical protein